MLLLRRLAFQEGSKLKQAPQPLEREGKQCLGQEPLRYQKQSIRRSLPSSPDALAYLGLASASTNGRGRDLIYIMSFAVWEGLSLPPSHLSVHVGSQRTSMLSEFFKSPAKLRMASDFRRSSFWLIQTRSRKTLVVIAKKSGPNLQRRALKKLTNKTTPNSQSTIHGQSQVEFQR